MGVWHLSGLGINPGAVTVPLTYVYLLLKQASSGDRMAKEFFKYSGESGEEFVGKPEAVIIFTSEEVINGKKQGDIRDCWFNTQKKNTAPYTIKDYLSNLLNKLQNKRFNPTPIKYFFCVKVKHDDFNDCFEKTAITLNALKEKEIWINMTGGTNQINAALFSSSGFTSAAVRYYYIFQTDTKLLHPEIKKPNFDDLRISIPPPLWHELPIFTFDMSRLYDELLQIFKTRPNVNVGQIKNILRNLGYPEQFFAKIRGSLIKVEGETATKGYMLDYWIKIWEELESTNINNFSDWKKWAEDKQILTEINEY